MRTRLKIYNCIPSPSLLVSQTGRESEKIQSSIFSKLCPLNCLHNSPMELLMIHLHSSNIMNGRYESCDV